ncbi:DUF3592 domain-containing protein [Verrucomicrobium sp. BvORR034]|uniref:DUF3592 domain-containing protein n=1 Tax=Verrucomicrobium sp. BvORR034 TaxID=1396418 RepID=UPI0006792B64|nr:DUF3592 domain-containing protein [Verrucomicrobium sp. BvORR034]
MKAGPWSWVLAGLLTLLGLISTGRTAWWLAHAERVTGVAGHSGYRASSTAKSAGTPVVYVTFSTLSGEGKTLNMTTWSTKTHPPGSPVPVVYDPQRPGKGKVDVWWNHWPLPVLTLLSGVILLVRALQLSRHA